MLNNVERDLLLTALKSWWGEFQRENVAAGHPNGNLTEQQRWVDFVASHYEAIARGNYTIDPESGLPISSGPLPPEFKRRHPSQWIDPDTGAIHRMYLDD